MSIVETNVETSLKNILLESAKLLFWKHGVRSVSVEEICKNSGVSKMTFYRNFKNKEAIALDVLDIIHNQSFNRYREIMDKISPFDDKVSALIQLEYEQIKGISTAFVEDIYKNPSFKERMADHQQKMQKEVIKDFSKAQQKGDIRADIKMEFILFMLKDMNAKMMDAELHKIYQTEEEIAMELTRFFFYGIFFKSSY